MTGALSQWGWEGGRETVVSAPDRLLHDSLVVLIQQSHDSYARQYRGITCTMQQSYVLIDPFPSGWGLGTSMQILEIT